MPDNIYLEYRSPEIRGLLHAQAPKGFAQAKEEVVDVWTKPIRLLENLTPDAKNRNRATQLTRHDPSVDLLSDAYDGWVLVRLADQTVGWVEMKQLEHVEHPTRPHEILLTPKEFLERYLGAPYLRGGTTLAGIDCSGLVQRYFAQVRGLVVPRHSSNQWKAGRSVRDDEEREEGDILNARNREASTDHVALFMDPAHILHACLDRQGVVVESPEEFQTRYAILGTTRI